MIGERIKALRLEKSMSQEELAKVLDKSRPTVTAYETNERMPDVEIIEKLADFFGVTIDYLLGRREMRTHAEFIIDSDTKALNEMLKGADSESRKLAAEILDNVFMTINDAIRNNDIELLKILKSMYRDIWQLNISVQSEGRLLINEDKFNRPESNFLYEKLREFSKHKSELDLATEKLFEYHVLPRLDKGIGIK